MKNCYWNRSRSFYEAKS